MAIAVMDSNGVSDANCTCTFDAPWPEFCVEIKRIFALYYFLSSLTCKKSTQLCRCGDLVGFVYVSLCSLCCIVFYVLYVLCVHCNLTCKVCIFVSIRQEK